MVSTFLFVHEIGNLHSRCGTLYSRCDVSCRGKTFKICTNSIRISTAIKPRTKVYVPEAHQSRRKKLSRPAWLHIVQKYRTGCQHQWRRRCFARCRPGFDSCRWQAIFLEDLATTMTDALQHLPVQLQQRTSFPAVGRAYTSYCCKTTPDLSVMWSDLIIEIPQFIFARCQVTRPTCTRT